MQYNLDAFISQLISSWWFLTVLKWTGMGEFNSDAHYIYYCGQESLRRDGIAIMEKKKSLKCSTWMQSQKWQEDLCSFPRQPFNIMVIQVYALTSNAKKLKLTVLWRPTRPSRTNTPKDVLFIIGDWNAVGHQETPGITGTFGLGVQNEAGQKLTEFCQENALVITNILFQQHKRRLYTWTLPDGQYQNQID